MIFNGLLSSVPDKAEQEATALACASSLGRNIEISLVSPTKSREEEGAGTEGGTVGGAGGGAGGETEKPASGQNSSRKLFCSYCHKEFSKSFDLAQHVRSHTGEKPYQCLICGRGFAQKSNVKKHMATHKVWPRNHSTLPAEPGQGVAGAGHSYSCPYCQQMLDSYPELKSHLKDHQEEKSYRCIVQSCGELFPDLDQFLAHTASHEDKLYRCHVCSRRFGDLNQLNLHSYSHLTDEQTREKQVFQCGKCRNKYTSAEALDHHTATVSHCFPCQLCDKEFSAERFLRKHLAVTHTEGTAQCEVRQALVIQISPVSPG